MTRTMYGVVLPLLMLAFTYNNDKPIPHKHYPANYFQSPIAHAILLSGTFGELRLNNFHSGIDIRSSKGLPGDPVFSAGEGYISKIKVESNGYGKSVFISHPNGYTTVYAHLDKFNAQLEAYVKAAQYARQSFEIELLPEARNFPIIRGEQIGYMGNTGASNGAHLHFEVRETISQNPINPLLFGLFVEDNVAPKMHSLKVYGLNEKREEQSARTFQLIQSGDRYSVKGDTLSFGADVVGFGLKVFDHLDGVSNWNGIYALSVSQNDRLIYEFDLESFSFSESRYINALCDYEEQVRYSSIFNRCYILPGNHLSIYKRQVNNGLIRLGNEGVSKISIAASDMSGNQSTLEFWIKKDDVAPVPSYENLQYFLPFDEGNMIRTEGLYLHLPAGTLYENLFLKYSATAGQLSGYYSDVHHLHENTTPVHKYFDIGIRPTVSIPAALKSKVFVAYSDGGKLVNCGGSWENGLLRAKVRNLGDYVIAADATPPSIQPVSFSSNMKGFKKMAFKISDDVATAANVDGLKYEASVDGDWILMEYDKKSQTLKHEFDGRIGSGEHELRLKVCDAVGNETVFLQKFIL